MSVTTRTITVRVDGDATKANKALGSVGGHAEGLGKKLFKIGGMIAAAFSVEKIIDFGKQAVKAMMDDQKSAAILAKTLQNVTKARKEDITAVEKYIKKTSLATGIADDNLRPAFAKIVRVTKDTTKAQKYLNLALDVSAGTGKDLSSVSTALSKALAGNFTALTRLGVPIDKATIKSKDLAKVMKVLEDTFGGSMATQAQTLSGTMAILQNIFAEMKEDIGYAMLPKLQEFAGWLSSEGVPAIQAFMDELFGGGFKSNRENAFGRVADSWSEVTPLQESAVTLAQAIKDLGTALGDMLKAMGDGSSPQSGLVRMINSMAQLVGYLEKATALMAKISDPMNKAAQGGQGANPIFLAAAPPVAIAWEWLKSLWGQEPPGNAIGGTIPAGSTRLVGERGPELWTPSTNGSITPNYQLGGAGGGGLQVTVNVAGNVIRERDLASSVRDQIAQLMRRRGLDPSILGV